MASSDSPRFVYKILPEAPPSPLPQTLPLSELDTKDGFIHLSTAHQVPTTSRLFFAQAEKLWLLKIPLEPVRQGLRWPNELPGCAHLYGMDLGLANIQSVKAIDRPAGEEWAQVYEGDEWMEQ